jgi:hypothetical protein
MGMYEGAAVEGDIPALAPVLLLSVPALFYFRRGLVWGTAMLRHLV